MKKKRIILLIVAIVLIVATAYVWLRLNNRWTDINGVTTVSERNTVYMNAKPGKDFYGGTGYLTVGEGKLIHAEYDIESGSIDIAFRIYVKGRANLNLRSSAFDDLPDSGEVFGKSGVSGKGSLAFEVAPGEYEVYFKSHDTIGSAIVTARRK